MVYNDREKNDLLSHKVGVEQTAKRKERSFA